MFGGYIAWSGLQAAQCYGGYSSGRGTIGLFLLAWGLFIVVAGTPKNATGQTPNWWRIGMVVMTIIGLAGAIALITLR